MDDRPAETRREAEGRAENVSLHEHLSAQVEALKELVNARLDATDKALSVALAALNERLAGMNEFRDTLRDQAARLATREQLEAVVARVDAELKSLQLTRAELQGKASESSVKVAQALAFLGAISGIIGTILALLRN